MSLNSDVPSPVVSSPSKGVIAPPEKREEAAQSAFPKPSMPSGKYNYSRVSADNNPSPESTNAERERAIPHADKKTTAAAPDGHDFPKAAQQVGLDSILPKMAKAMQTAAAASSANSETGQLKYLIDSYYESLKLLISIYSFSTIIDTINKASANNGIKYIDTILKNVVIGSHNKLYADFVKYGANIPITEYNKVTEIGTTPPNVVKLSQVPSLYRQEYYVLGKHPYPGYIEWVKDGIEENTKYYTLRSVGENYYEVPSDEIVALSAIRLRDVLKPYFRDSNLTSPKLNKILLAEIENIKNDLWEKAVGKNSKSKAGGISPDIIGKVAKPIQNQLKTQLPRSVLKKTSVTKTQQRHAELQAAANDNGLKLIPTTEIPPLSPNMEIGLTAEQKATIQSASAG